MTDNELRGLVLQRLYELRHRPDDTIKLHEIAEIDPANPNVISNICEQLAEHGLISWRVLRGQTGPFDGFGKISAFGVDVIEGKAKAPIAINIIHDTSIRITGSTNVQIGNNNSQNVRIDIGTLERAIDTAAASPAEKAEAKSLLSRLTSNPTFAAIVGALVSMAASSTN